MIKEGKVERRKLACEDYGEQLSKREGAGEERGHSSYKRSQLATHDAKIVF